MFVTHNRSILNLEMNFQRINTFDNLKQIVRLIATWKRPCETCWAVVVSFQRHIEWLWQSRSLNSLTRAKKLIKVMMIKLNLMNEIESFSRSCVDVTAPRNVYVVRLGIGLNQSLCLFRSSSAVVKPKQTRHVTVEGMNKSCRENAMMNYVNLWAGFCSKVYVINDVTLTMQQW